MLHLQNIASPHAGDKPERMAGAANATIVPRLRGHSLLPRTIAVDLKAAKRSAKEMAPGLGDLGFEFSHSVSQRLVRWLVLSG
jgi:hypothetical protein